MRKIGDMSIIRKVYFVKRFFRRGLMKDDLRGEGKVPVRRERLTIERIVEDISDILKNSSGRWIEITR